MFAGIRFRGEIMKVAVLLTGAERSLDRVAPLLRTNLIDPNDAILFFAVETDSPDRVLSRFDGCRVGGHDLRPTFRDAEYEALKQMILAGNRPALRDEVFQRDGECWDISYVWNSGTFVQYVQVWKSWLKLLEYERTHGAFDVVVRWRSDIVLTRPIYLSKFTLDSDERTNRSMGDPVIHELIPTLDHLTTSVYQHRLGYPQTKKVVWTMGCEQAWIANRDTFELFGSMVFEFGLWDSGRRVAFCSEAFFQEFCTAHHITHWGFIENDHTLYTTQDTYQQYLWSILR